MIDVIVTRVGFITLMTEVLARFAPSEIAAHVDVVDFRRDGEETRCVMICADHWTFAGGMCLNACPFGLNVMIPSC